MKLGQFARRVGTRTMTRRVIRSWPWVGGAIALLTIAGTVRKKGFVGGTLDTALNAMPVVGTLKNLAEASRGRDFIPYRSTSRTRSEEITAG